jgi:uncharacterized phage protein (TIGR02218 family)
MAQGSTTLAHCVHLLRRDGFVLALTLDHDRPLPFEGVVYQPAFGAMPSTVETSSQLNVDNLDAKGALMALGVQEKDIAAGVWDGCAWKSFRVNWRDLSMGADPIKTGTFGELTVGRNTFNAEVRGITQVLQQTIGDVAKPACNANLFDTRCGVSMTEGVWMFSGVTVNPQNNRQFAATVTQPDDFFAGGKVVWTSGANAGLAMEIQSHLGNQITLQEPMPYPIVTGDACVLYAGCLKRDTDCRDKFDNIVRFRGFPTVPGQDQMLRGPE